jgi:hypothetical protein
MNGRVDEGTDGWMNGLNNGWMEKRIKWLYKRTLDILSI